MSLKLELEMCLGMYTKFNKNINYIKNFFIY